MDIATLGFRVDASDADSGAASLDRLNAAGKRVDATAKTVAGSFDRAASAQKRNTKITNDFVKVQKSSSFQTANLAAQLNDIGVTLASGQSPFQIALQQGTQINQVLGQQGARGAVAAMAGAFTSLINPVSLATIGIIGFGGAAIQWLVSSGEKAKTTQDAIEDLSSSVDEYAKASKEARRTTADLVKEYGVLTSEVIKLNAVQKDLSESRALKQFESTALAAATAFGDFSALVEGRGQARTAALQSMAKELGVSLTQSKALAQSFEGIIAAKTFEAQAEAVRQTRQELLDATGGVQEMNDTAEKLYSQLISISQESITVANNAQDIEPGLAAATSQAEALEKALINASEAARSAVDNANSALKAAQARAQFRDNPVALAQANAGNRFDQSTGDTSGFDPIIQKGLEAQRDAVIARAKETAVLTERTKELNRLDREREASANKAANEARRKDEANAKRAERDARRITEQRAKNRVFIQDLRREIDVQVMSGEERQRNLVILAEERAVRAAISRLGKDASQQEIAAVRELIPLRMQILEENRKQQEALELELQLYGDLGNKFGTLFNDVIDGTKSAKDAVIELGLAFTQAYIKAQLLKSLESSGFSGTGGGSFLTSAISAIFGGFRADGGPIESGKAYIVGERGPEMIVPNQSGYVVPNQSLRGNMDSYVTPERTAANTNQPPQQVDLYVHSTTSMDTSGNLETFVKIVSDQTSTDNIRVYDKGLDERQKRVV